MERKERIMKKQLKAQFWSDVKWFIAQIIIGLTLNYMIVYIFTFYYVDILAYILAGVALVYDLMVYRNYTEIKELYNKI